MQHRLLALCTCLALAGIAAPAAAQRASLADRVAALEMRAATPQVGVDLLNQVTALRTQVQTLQSRVEELEHENGQLRESMKAQYLDTDSRLARLEGGAPAAGAAPAPVPAAPRAAASTTPATPKPAPAAADALPTGDEATAYGIAFDALKGGRYAEASRLFAAFMDRFPGGVYAPNALYWLGESYYVTQNYALALAPFEQLIDRFPTHDKAPGAMLKLGLTKLGLRDRAGAESAFEAVLSRWPDSDAARLARERLQSLRLTGGR